MTTPIFTLEPFWAGYAIVLVICVGWAWRLSREAEQRDAETTRQDAAEPEREIAPLLRDMGAGE